MRTKGRTSIFTSVLVLAITLLGCNNQEASKKNLTEAVKEGDYKISPVSIRNVKLEDEFWLPIIEKVQEKTIDFALEKCRQEGRFENFLIAGGQMEGKVRGEMPFDDTDVYKIIEGASNSLISSPNPPLQKLLDSLIGIIKIGQEKDGYLTTWRTINPANPPADWVKVEEGKRWEYLAMSHELYNAGHLFEAAAVHYKATGKRSFLDIALKNADLMTETFGDGDGKISTVPGHQIIETGLIKLYLATGKKSYLDLAKYFLDQRGNESSHELFNEYAQDHKPVIDQKEAVGHAVRAVYMYAGMTDIVAIKKDSAYLKAVNALWENMVSKKMYVTGGIGARHEGESFGDNYELPNLTAYNETCASIGNVYWNHRLHSLTGDVKYFDIIERTLYNGLISGLSLDGKQFFYPNALESDGVYNFNRGACTRQDWFDCSCCPSNLIRFLPSIPGLIYSKTDNELFVNLYASNETKVELQDQIVEVSQKTNYPWDGNIKFRVNPEKESKFSIKFRIPGWARNEVLPSDLYHYAFENTQENTIVLNGEPLEVKAKEGYFSIEKNWKAGDIVELRFPMDVKEVVANPLVVEDKDKMALERGPIVYAIEEKDNKNDFDAITLNTTDSFDIKWEKDLLEGVNTISSERFLAIPYYAWSNRGVGKMKVWLPTK